MAKYKFVIVACARWETKNILEWVAYHRSVGFEHIYLYCNDEDPTELYECLMPILTEKNPFITFVYYQFQGFQAVMYKHFLKNYSHEAEWLTFLDIDEFLALKGHDNIHSFMQDYEQICDSIYFNWIFFGNSGFVNRQEGSILLQYTKRARYLNHHTKTLTRRSSLDIAKIIKEQNKPFWHGWSNTLVSNMRQINVLGDLMDGFYDDFPNKPIRYLDQENRRERIQAIAAIYHYAFRSEKDIDRRLKRGVAGDFQSQIAFKNVQDEGYLKEFLENFSQVEDVYLRDYWRRQLEGGWRASIIPRPPGPNIALGKPATQSSISEWSLEDAPEKDASRLVSGQFSGLYNNHTGFDDPPWWRVDLGAPTEITEIRIYNRLDVDTEIMRRSARLALQISQDGGTWTTIFQRDDDTPFGGIDGFPAIWRTEEPVIARFIRISGIQSGYLHLDQVEVFG
ncbi:MAG: glycosyltransferase family 2 protein, partial [Rhizomicrobium sp.]